MLGHFGWRAVLAIVALDAGATSWSSAASSASWRRRPALPDVEEPEDDDGAGSVLLPVPAWLTATHMAFMAWTVLTSHYPALFLGGFLIFLGLRRATAAYQSRIELKAPLLVGFFLAGLVIHGGLQGWWIAPVLASLSETPLFLSSTLLTAFNDNALITYLATLVPNLDEQLKIADRRGRGHGRGPDRHRQRAQPGRPGPARPLLRRRHPADWAPARRAAADADRDRGVPAAVDRGASCVSRIAGDQEIRRISVQGSAPIS